MRPNRPRLPPRHLIAPDAPASGSSAGTPPHRSPDAPATSPAKETSAASAAPGTSLFIVTPSERDARILLSAKCFLANPPAGDGEVTVYVVVDPHGNADAAWIEAQMVLALGFQPSAFSEPHLIWSDPDAKRA